MFNHATWTIVIANLILGFAFAFPLAKRVARLGRKTVLGVMMLCLFIGGSGCSEKARAPLSSAEIQAIKAASQTYGAGWLSNDPERVMATLTDDAVIVPSGMLPIKGQKAIREFWWPEGSPPTVVTQFAVTDDEVGGDGDFGFVRGTFALSFEYDGTGYSGGGTYISLMKRLPDGTWRISHRSWSDTPAAVE